MSPDRWGISEQYQDAGGVWRQVPPATVARLRELIGEPPAAPARPSVVRRGSGAPIGSGHLELEDGGTMFVRGRLPDEVPTGYHRFVDGEGSASPLVVSPGRCYLPARRSWGWAVQLYATRSEQSWGIGDLADLARLGKWSALQGAGHLLVNPLGAVIPGTAQPDSPYSPASRRLRNPLYLRVEDVPGADRAREAVARAATAGRRLNATRRIERNEVWRLKLAALEAIWDAGPPTDEFSSWRLVQPGYVELFARWSVLVERHGPAWRSWPADCRSPTGPGVAEVAEVEPKRVAFFVWLQWLVLRQLAVAGSSVSLVEDLPIGVDRGGFDAWSWPEVLAEGVSVGAPPDEFNPAGQDWGVPPFVPWRLREAGYEPFVETVRAGLAGGGGLRIDHVMGLSRLWWVPDGAPPSDGAYVGYPAEDLLGILALESQRARAVVIGEDLGTVEASTRVSLARHGVLSYRVLWFEERSPSRWPTRAMGAVTTHDLPTVAGLWTGEDLAEQRAAGVEGDGEATVALRERLRRRGGLDEAAGPEAAVRAAYRLLAGAPCLLLTATLEDAVAEPDRPNLPGTVRPENWSRALPVTLDQLETHPLALAIAESLGKATGRGSE